MDVLVVVLALEHLDAIPQKNMRTLAGKPLIYYPVHTALNSQYKPDVFVCSDDEETLDVSAKYGAHPWPLAVTEGDSLLTPLITRVYAGIAGKSQKAYDAVVFLRPTSPLLKTKTLDKALEQLMTGSGDESATKAEVLISAKKEVQMQVHPAPDRLVSQQTRQASKRTIPPVFIETETFLVAKAPVLAEDRFRESQMTLFVLPADERVDIVTYEDFSLCEHYLNRKHIVFVLTGNPTVGMGHVYRALVLASHISNHRVSFLLDKDSELGYRKIAENKLDVYIQTSENIVDDILALRPDIVVNDILDTSTEYMQALKNAGLTLVNFEDLGEGAKLADLVINDLYPETPEIKVLPNHYFGPDYFCAREEFIATPPKLVTPVVRQVLLTFGGTDPCNLTRRVLEAIHGYCTEEGIAIIVVTGMGYRQLDTLAEFAGITLHQNIKTMSTFMHEADIVFTSAGRTIYEVACIGTPAIVLAQNKREMTHFWASAENGFINLGPGSDVSPDTILNTFKALVDNVGKRRYMSELMLGRDIKNGVHRVIRLINAVIDHASQRELPVLLDSTC